MRRIARHRGFASGAVALVWVLACVSSPRPLAAKTFMTEGFATGTARPATLVLLPPHAEFIKAKALATEEMVEECAALETAAVKALLQDLGAKGYEIRYLTPEELAENPQLLQLVMGINARYDGQWPGIVEKPKTVKDGGYALGAEVTELCTLLQVDGLLVSRIQAVAPTFGRAMLLGMLSGGMARPDSYGRLDLSFVSRDGVVEAYFFRPQPAALKQLVRKPDQVMTKACRKGLKKFPAAGATADPSASGEDEDDIVGELEQLLAKESGEGES